MTTAASPLPLSQANPRALKRFVFCCIAAGALLRLFLSVISQGTNDAVIWQDIATHVSQVGYLEAYRTDRLMNHPPLAVVWSCLSLWVGGDLWFTFIMKLPGIAGDLLSIWLVAQIWLKRGNVAGAKAAAVCMALNPIAIIISGYHCNTDNFYAFLSLLAMYLIDSGGGFFLGGLALAAAINVKLIPILLVLPALSFCRNGRDARRLLAGLAIGIIPFLPLLIWAPDAVKANMLTYVPPGVRWGVGYILRDIRTHPRFTPTADAMIAQYSWIGRYAILLGMILLSGISWRTKRWTACELALILYALFLALAPGFGHQYLVILVPLLATLSVWRSWLYAVLASVFAVFAYCPVCEDGKHTGQHGVQPGAPDAQCRQQRHEDDQILMPKSRGQGKEQGVEDQCQFAGSPSFSSPGNAAQQNHAQEDRIAANPGILCYHRVGGWGKARMGSDVAQNITHSPANARRNIGEHVRLHRIGGPNQKRQKWDDADCQSSEQSTCIAPISAKRESRQNQKNGNEFDIDGRRQGQAPQEKSAAAVDQVHGQQAEECVKIISIAMIPADDDGDGIQGHADGGRFGAGDVAALQPDLRDKPDRKQIAGDAGQFHDEGEP